MQVFRFRLFKAMGRSSRELSDPFAAGVRCGADKKIKRSSSRAEKTNPPGCGRLAKLTPLGHKITRHFLAEPHF
jgi:hypothetical protein